MYFRQKHVETGPNWSYRLATFLNYHMPLKVFLYHSGCGLANSSTEVDWPILLNPVCCTQGTLMPTSVSFVSKYLAELHFGNG